MVCRVRHLLSLIPLAAIAVLVVLTLPVIAPAQDDAGTTTADTVVAKRTPIAPLPARHVTARDARNDHGHALMVRWEKSPDDGEGKNNVIFYRIERSPRLEGPYDKLEHPPGGQYRMFHSAVYNEAVWRIVPAEWDTVAEVPSGEARYEDRGSKWRDAADYLPDHMDFQYRVVAVSADQIGSATAPSEPTQAHGQIIHLGKLAHIGIPVLIFTTLVLGFISLAKRGRELYIRPLAGISAVDEAIGRATEMNRPILYVLGLGAADEIGTIASFTILSRVAKKVAEHRTELLVPCYDAVVMSIAQETVKQAYLDAGRPDEYRDDIVYFVTQEQFAYVASVNGTMIRRQTATNFYLGVFFAESLILAETGSIAGSIQISGTDRTTQLPFFIVACDYTLIGEELYAASAYLGREPRLLGTLKAQDYAKSIFMIVMVIGILAAAFQFEALASLFEITF